MNRNRLVELYLLEGDLIPFHSYRRSAVDLKLEVVKRNVLLNRLQNMRIFAYSSTREQSNERSGTKLKTESETGERLSPHTPYGRVRLARFALKTLTPRFTDFFTDFEKKNRLFCSLTFKRH